jgi:hypothetical protein
VTPTWVVDEMDSLVRAGAAALGEWALRKGGAGKRAIE